MCGINGIFNFSGQHLQNADALISRMNDCIAHRGPDDSGTWHDDEQQLFFGHRRLSIIDLSATGHQPMLNAHGSAIVFNGEIYNYKELKTLLTGHQFKSESDTEILLELYQRDGHNSLQHLNGMFAFAIWNNERKQLQLARDRIGKKPLYYTITNGIFSFSSEIKSLLTLPWIKAEVDHEAMYHFLTFNQLSAPQTLFKNIYKLHPGYCLTVDKTGIAEHKQYWEVEYADLNNRSENELSAQLLDELRKSIRYRMVADVPVGAFLSGGVDSSAIVALMNESGFQNIKTYSIGFKDQPDYTELKYAETIAKKYDTHHFEKVVSSADLEELISGMAKIFDEPLADSTSIPIYFISKLARENGTIVVQTGDGSDELLSGYRNWMHYSKLYPYYHFYTKFPVFIKKNIAALASVMDETSPKTEILKRASLGEEFFWGGAKAFKETNKNTFLSSQYKKETIGLNSYKVIEEVKSRFSSLKHKHPHLNDIDWMCYLGLKQQVPYRYLYRMDKLGMANSIEIRSPFLDYNLVNFALSIPSKYKIKNNEPKYILKKSLEGILDYETLYRKKMGFCVPLKEWSGDYMINYVENNLSAFCKRTGIFDSNGLKQMISAIKSGNENYTNQLWTLYFLMSWYEEWIN